MSLKTAYGYPIAAATSDAKSLLREGEPTLWIWTLAQALVRFIYNEIHLNLVTNLTI